MTPSDTPRTPNDDAPSPEGALASTSVDGAGGAPATPAGQAAPTRPAEKPDDHGGPALFGGLR